MLYKSTCSLPYWHYPDMETVMIQLNTFNFGTHCCFHIQYLFILKPEDEGNSKFCYISAEVT
jgi:hypothetical protein